MEQYEVPCVKQLEVPCVEKMRETICLEVVVIAMRMKEILCRPVVVLVTIQMKIKYLIVSKYAVMLLSDCRRFYLLMKSYSGGRLYERKKSRCDTVSKKFLEENKNSSMTTNDVGNHHIIYEGRYGNT